LENRFPTGAPFGVGPAPLLEAVDFGGIEQMGCEFGKSPVSANGACESSQGLGESIRSATMAGEGAQARTAWPPQAAADE
jgi:hypothetical protein